MNPTQLLPASAFAIAVFLFGVGSASGQTGNSTINEDIQLNITEERITEADLARSTQAELTADNLRVRVGVSVEARQIDATLRGVTGRVRFRASLEEILQRIARLRSELNSR